MADQTLLMFIDGMSLAYRGHFALMRAPRLTSDGRNTSAAFVFVNTVLSLIEQQQPTHLLVAFDTRAPTFRHELFPEYKATRHDMPEDLAAMLPVIRQLCEALGFPMIERDGYEADDLIGTLSAQADAAGCRSLMVTPDKDYAQLVSPTATLVRPVSKGGGFDHMGPAEVCAHWGIERVEQVIDILGLMGDKSDNIPGIPGIGPKTAQKLIADYGSMEGVFEHIGELKGKRKENLQQHQEQGRLSRRLVTIERQVPVELDLAAWQRREPDPDQARRLFAELEFRGLGKRLFGDDFEPADELAADGQGAEPATIADTFHSYRCVSDADEQRDIIAALQRLPAVCLDLETTGLDARRCRPLGVALCWQAQEACYLALPEDEAACRERLAWLAPVLARVDLRLIGHHLKYDLAVLRQWGVTTHCNIFDTMLAAQLVDPDGRHSMDELAVQHLGYRPIAITSLIGPKGPEQRSLAELPPEQVADYACEDADVTWQLAEVLEERLDEAGCRQVFETIECPLVPVLVAMEADGIRLDRQALEELAEQLETAAAEDRRRVFDLAGEEFNLNSPRQLGVVLFDKMALVSYARKTKTGQYKTDEQVLRRLASQHEIAQCILDYRMRTKLKSTYVDALPQNIDERTGRVHTHYDQLATATGRLSSHDPNLQNIPIRSEAGREVRRAFVADGADYQLLSADYSQIELRIAAALSGDANLRAVFAAGEDVHAATAARLYDVAIDQVDADMRRRAKTVNFSILFGVTAFGLSERLGISRGEGKQLIEAYYSSFPTLRDWMDGVLEEARARGYVETITGRRRYLRDINSRNHPSRQAAERLAINSPVQGSEADLIKKAMVDIAALLREEGCRSRMLLQVHDELVFELHADEAEELPPRIAACMRDALPLEVPIVVEWGVGRDWLSAH